MINPPNNNLTPPIEKDLTPEDVFESIVNGTYTSFLERVDDIPKPKATASGTATTAEYLTRDLLGEDRKSEILNQLTDEQRARLSTSDLKQIDAQAQALTPEEEEAQTRAYLTFMALEFDLPRVVDLDGKEIYQKDYLDFVVEGVSPILFTTEEEKAKFATEIDFKLEERQQLINRADGLNYQLLNTVPDDLKWVYKEAKKGEYFWTDAFDYPEVVDRLLNIDYKPVLQNILFEVLMEQPAGIALEDWSDEELWKKFAADVEKIEAKSKQMMVDFKMPMNLRIIGLAIREVTVENNLGVMQSIDDTRLDDVFWDTINVDVYGNKNKWNESSYDLLPQREDAFNKRVNRLLTAKIFDRANEKLWFAASGKLKEALFWLQPLWDGLHKEGLVEEISMSPLSLKNRQPYPLPDWAKEAKPSAEIDAQIREQILSKPEYAPLVAYAQRQNANPDLDPDYIKELRAKLNQEISDAYTKGKNNVKFPDDWAKEPILSLITDRPENNDFSYIGIPGIDNDQVDAITPKPTDSVTDRLEKYGKVVSILGRYLSSIDDGQAPEEWWKNDLSTLDQLGYLVYDDDLRSSIIASIRQLISFDPNQPNGKMNILQNSDQAINSPEFKYKLAVLNAAQSSFNEDFFDVDKAMAKFYEAIYYPPDDMSVSTRLVALSNYNSLMKFKGDVFKKDTGTITQAFRIDEMRNRSNLPRTHTLWDSFGSPPSSVANEPEAIPLWNQTIRDNRAELIGETIELLNYAYKFDQDTASWWLTPENQMKVQEELDRVFNLSSRTTVSGQEIFFIDFDWKEVSPFVIRGLIPVMFNHATTDHIPNSRPSIFKSIESFMNTTLQMPRSEWLGDDPNKTRQFLTALELASTITGVVGQEYEAAESLFGLTKGQVQALRLLSLSLGAASMSPTGSPAETGVFMQGLGRPQNLGDYSKATMEQLALAAAQRSEFIPQVIGTISEVMRGGGSAGALPDTTNEALKVITQLIGQNENFPTISKLLDRKASSNNETYLQEWWRSFTRIFPEFNLEDSNEIRDKARSTIQNIQRALNFGNQGKDWENVLRSWGIDQSFLEDPVIEDDRFKKLLYVAWSGLLSNPQMRRNLESYMRARIAAPSAGEFTFQLNEVFVINPILNSQTDLIPVTTDTNGNLVFASRSAGRDWIRASAEADQPFYKLRVPAGNVRDLLLGNFTTTTERTTGTGVNPNYSGPAIQFNTQFASQIGMSLDSYNKLVTDLVDGVIFYFHLNRNYFYNNRDTEMIDIQLEVIRRILETTGATNYSGLTLKDFENDYDERTKSYPKLKQQLSSYSPTYSTAEVNSTNLHAVKLLKMQDGESRVIAFPSLFYVGPDPKTLGYEYYDQHKGFNEKNLDEKMAYISHYGGYTRDQNGTYISTKGAQSQ